MFLVPVIFCGADFGPGFYLTNNFQQASNWAKRKTNKPIPNQSTLELLGLTIADFLKMKKDFSSVVLEFKITDTVKWEELNYTVFNEVNPEWQQFVWNMRHSNRNSTHRKDWIYGPVADGGLVSVHYQNIKAYNNKNQLAILTDEAAQYIELLEVIKC